jgi:hypothetical protein
MISAADQKTYWSLGEIVMWIRTRDQECVAAISDLTEEEAMVQAMFAFKSQWDPRALLGPPATNSDADWASNAPQYRDKSLGMDRPVLMPPDQALDNLHRRVQSGRVQMTAIRCDVDSERQIRVPLAELNDLRFRLVPGHGVAPVGLWSRSRRDTLVWRSPQFLCVDGIGAWPARNTKTAAVSIAILRHLREIMTPEAPLTKVEAQQRCMAEVASAYSGAFKKAWAELESSCKRGRGKHGPRAK